MRQAKSQEYARALQEKRPLNLKGIGLGQGGHGAGAGQTQIQVDGQGQGQGRAGGPGPGPGPGPGLIGGRGRSRAEDQGQVGLDGVGPPYTSVSRPELVFPRPSLPPSPLRTAVIRSYCVCLRARMSFERLVLY